MGDLTKNLSRREFACECGCGFDTVDIDLAINLQRCVDHFAEGSDNVWILVTGPNRCKEHNEKVQKEYNDNYVTYSSKTQHMYARAADFKLFYRDTGKQINPDRVAEYLNDCYKSKHGIGQYSNRTHYDTRTGAGKRWEG